MCDVKEREQLLVPPAVVDWVRQEQTVVYSLSGYVDADNLLTAG